MPITVRGTRLRDRFSVEAPPEALAGAALATAGALAPTLRTGTSLFAVAATATDLAPPPVVTVSTTGDGVGVAPLGTAPLGA